MTGSVLIVDDSLTVRMNLAEAFQTAGFSCVLCVSIAEARAALARGPVALVILDVVLPDGDGVALLEEIRAGLTTCEVPILMLSSEAEVADRVRGIKKGADDYVGKPYDVDYVVARGRELVHQRLGARASEATLILVIDDSVTFREALGRALSVEGYGVVACSTGEEGLRLAASRRPDAIVVDGVMPGIDGATVIRKVRLDAALRGTPCLLLTASDEVGAELHALDAGADAFVRKDDGVELILARLAAALRSTREVLDEVASLAGPKRILAVDDSPTYLEAIGAMLRDQGYDVVLARSGEEAIELLAVQAVDCILLDLLMPGLGGKETCRRIKGSPGVRDVPLIMLTAVEDRTAMIDGLATGADDYISKSSDFDVLKARVQAQIRRKQFEDQNRRIREDLLHSELEAAEARAGRRVAEARAAMADQLERKNQELEAFSYSVSHDLRAPLRSIAGFSQILLEDHAAQLDANGYGHLLRVRAAAQRMGELIDDLLLLARVSKGELVRGHVNLADLAREILEGLAGKEPAREVAWTIEDRLDASGDRGLLRVLLENVLGNAWKFTSKSGAARIEIGVQRDQRDSIYFVRDNGAGFDMAYAQRLFGPFQRMHAEADFPGTGIGLATVRRIVERHGGKVWADAALGRGATIFFTLPIVAAAG